MRKRHKIKRRSCGLCKPHKAGISCRWKNKELELLRLCEEAERELSRGQAKQLGVGGLASLMVR